MDSYIRECSIEFLSVRRAERLVPPEFLEGYRWFQENEGKQCDHLPMAPYAPEGLPLKLASQAGIHCPSYDNLPSRGAGARRYALSIHSSHGGYYQDRAPTRLDDGTWLFEYCAHSVHYGDRGKRNYNQLLVNCMDDGVPVAVMIQNADRGYTIMGLAFVESYNAITGTFHLHGPINAQTEAEGCFSRIDSEGMEQNEVQLLRVFEPEDERVRVIAERVRREGQARFREQLLRAYEGCCALTSIDIENVLQAAHIYPYRGKKSQVVSNGLLLRADIHQLFDAHLLSIDPETFKVHLSDRLLRSEYGKYQGATIDLPADIVNRPDEKLLELHFQEFDTMQRRSA